MKHFFLEKRLDYDGSQLRSLFAYLGYGILGDSIVGWRGACDVTLEHMVDGEDLRQNAKICGNDMVHFILEKFDEKLSTGVAVQRLMAAIIKDVLEELAPLSRGQWIREGDDIYRGDKKFSISIATVSPVSCLVHFAVNVTNEGTPVPTVSLSDVGIDPQIFAMEVLKKVSSELITIREATQKVRWVT